MWPANVTTPQNRPLPCCFNRSGDASPYRAGFNLPITALAMAAASMLLLGWLSWENRQDLDHQAYAMADIIAVLGTAYDHYGHAELQLAAPNAVASQRELTAAEVAAFQGHEALPPWVQPALDDLTGNWEIHYLVHYPADTIHPMMMLNLEPRHDLSSDLVNRMRNQLNGRFPALVSGGIGSVRSGIGGDVRILAENIIGRPLDDDELAFLTWPMAGINPNWLPRTRRAGVETLTMTNDLALSGNDLTGIGRTSVRALQASGNLSPTTTAVVNLEDLDVSGNGNVADMTVNGTSLVTGPQIITTLKSGDMSRVGELEAQSTLTALGMAVDRVVANDGIRVAGDLTGQGRDLVVDGTVRAGEAFARTIDPMANLDFDTLVVRGFYLVDDAANVGTVTINPSGTCIGCQSSVH